MIVPMMFPVLLFSIVAVVVIAANHTVKPTPFPTSATWSAHLLTTNRSDLCPECTFDGRHSINSDENMVHVRWFYGPTNDTFKSTYTNFADIVLGSRQTMYQVPIFFQLSFPRDFVLTNVYFLTIFLTFALLFVQVRGDNSRPASCMKIAHFTMQNFNTSWADAAVYEGDVWFQSRLCRKFTNVCKFFFFLISCTGRGGVHAKLSILLIDDFSCSHLSNLTNFMCTFFFLC